MRDTIKEIDDGMTDAMTIAAKVFHAADDEDIIYLISREIIHMRRTVNRMVEDMSDLGDAGKHSQNRKNRGAVVTKEDAVRDFLITQFFVPDEGYVTWGEATVDQHLRRAEYQRGYAETIMGDVERHEAAAQILRDRKVKSLNKLPKKYLGELAE